MSERDFHRHICLNSWRREPKSKDYRDLDPFLCFAITAPVKEKNEQLLLSILFRQL
jgi:catechol-2,3-dioxygenase